MSKTRKEDPKRKRLFAEPQSDLFDKSLEEELGGSSGPVECLGMTFESDEARREYFLEKLRIKLQDPEFRKIPGFPKGEDEDILRLSDPPYYTACPNPFLEDFVRCYGRPYEPEEEYHREPFAVDVSVGKTDALYRAHSYHTKVPHLAIVPSILHYTEPGDTVLDGFSGSGMTGVGAQWCGSAPNAYRKKLEKEWLQQGWNKPKWGARRAILGDLGPAATFIAANYNIPFDVAEFAEAAQQILDDLETEIGWMYETLHTDGKAKARINYTVWSEVFSCVNCSGEIVFLEVAFDTSSKKVKKDVVCNHCGASAKKEQHDLGFETFLDPATGETHQLPKRTPFLINYSVAGVRFEKSPSDEDIQVLRTISALPTPAEVPFAELPDTQMSRVGRVATTRVKRVSHFFLSRQAQALAALWRRVSEVQDTRLRNALLFFAEQAIWGMSVLNRYSPSHFSQVNRALSGVYYVASQISEVSPWYILDGKLDRLSKAFRRTKQMAGSSVVSTGDCASIEISNESVDYIFTDPPFGENIYYADLNFLVESWHRVWTDSEPEAIVDRVRKKGTPDYQELMHQCFAEYHRVLKPGRWMTVVFSNSSNAIWRAIQEAIGAAGFVVADVRTLDKKSGSFKAVTSTAVKQDLIISAYKPTKKLAEQFRLQQSSEDSAWAFTREHLANVPVFVSQHGEAEVVVERTPQMLHDRMIAFHVQRGAAVPLDTGKFLAGVAQRFPERDGMYFLPEQVAEYDKKRAKVTAVEQLTLFPSDEATAIQWIRQQLQVKPQTQQDLTPIFHKEIHNWAKHEKTIDIRDLLEQNFLKFEGTGPVPAPIHSYLSTNFKDLRNLEKDDPKLKAKAKDRWYVPSPERQGDLEKLREKSLFRIFEEYRTSPQKKIKKDLRTEAIRAGFKAAYEANDLQAIIDVAEKIPDSVLQEDEKLIMYYDVASTRLGE